MPKSNMTQEDIDWVFGMAAMFCTQPKWTEHLSYKAIMENIRENLQNHTGKTIVPCGMSWGMVVDSDEDGYWKQQDENLKKDFKEEFDKAAKYWNGR